MFAWEALKLNHTVAVAKARLDNLVAMATDYRQARAVRLFVSAMRRRLPDADGTLARSDFEDWCHRALAQADELDPIKTWRGS